MNDKDSSDEQQNHNIFMTNHDQNFHLPTFNTNFQNELQQVGEENSHDIVVEKNIIIKHSKDGGESSQDNSLKNPELFNKKYEEYKRMHKLSSDKNENLEENSSDENKKNRDKDSKLKNRYNTNKFSIRDFWTTKTVRFKEKAFSNFEDMLEPEKQIEYSREEDAKNETINISLQEGLSH